VTFFVGVDQNYYPSINFYETEVEAIVEFLDAKASHLDGVDWTPIRVVWGEIRESADNSAELQP